MPRGRRSARRSTTCSRWAQKSWDLSAYKGQTVQFRFRVATDGGVSSEAFVDDIAVTTDGVAGTVDDVESGAGAWTAKGASPIIDGTTSKQVQDFYFAENRVYSGYDATLKTGPYNFGWGTTKPDWVERFPYQNGMLVWFANGEYGDNNTIDHPGGGEVLPGRRPPGAGHAQQRQRHADDDGQPSPAVRRHLRPGEDRRGDLPPQRCRDRRPVAAGDPDVRRLATPNRYWSAANPWASTKVAGSGTTMTVTKTRDGGNELQVMVKFK